MDTRPPFQRRYQQRQQQAPDTHRINQKIIAKEVRLIGAEGEQLGIVSIREALARAEEAGLDLVEVAGQVTPPVCKLMDYGKFKYQEQKKEVQNRKHRQDQEMKELRIRYRTDVGALDTKLKQAREFLADGHKVKFSMQFKGREVMYTELGIEKFNLLAEKLADIATIFERHDPLDQKRIHIIFAPLKQK
ncbi:MAG TPA: translation initiation factor IF-3 [Oligoflexia bacterium]|mgnify:CR=1 FL=1|nr:translation initiation factor IF-3 [Oligoflexia bacterium]HMP27513.1 translation initiation factor IF-3 [Oligoflexia bacterium]